MNNVPLMKVMELAEDVECLVSEVFDAIKTRDDIIDFPNMDSDVYYTINQSMRKLRELKKIISNLVIENEIT